MRVVLGLVPFERVAGSVTDPESVGLVVAGDVLRCDVVVGVVEDDPRPTIADCRVLEESVAVRLTDLNAVVAIASRKVLVDDVVVRCSEYSNTSREVASHVVVDVVLLDCVVVGIAEVDAVLEAAHVTATYGDTVRPDSSIPLPVPLPVTVYPAQSSVTLSAMISIRPVWSSVSVVSVVICIVPVVADTATAGSSATQSAKAVRAAPRSERWRSFI
jgi:hypothetical protein